MSARSTPAGTSGELLEQRGCPLSVAGEPVKLAARNRRSRPRRGRPASARRRARELGRGGGRPAGRGLPGGGLQLGCDRRRPGRRRRGQGGVPAPRGRRQPRQGRGEPHGASRGRLPVTDGRKQRVWEANARAVERDDSLSCGGVERPDDASRSPCAAVTTSTVGRPAAAARRRRGSRPAAAPVARREAREAAVNAQRLAWQWASLPPYELPSQLEREEGVALRSLPHTGEFGSAQLQFDPIPEQVMSALRLSGPTRELLSRSSGKERSSSNGAGSAPRAEWPEGRRAPRAAAEAPRKDQGRGRVEPLHIVERDQHGAHTPPAAQESRSASPIARARRLRPARPARARPPARAAVAEPAMETSSSTGESRSESPAKASEASASTLRWIRTQPNRSSASSTPASQRIVLPIRPRRRAPAPPGPAPRREERLHRAELLVAPDDVARHRDQTSAASSTVARRAASPTRRTPSFR